VRMAVVTVHESGLHTGINVLRIRIGPASRQTIAIRHN
jgi:hypothetical protein